MLMYSRLPRLLFGFIALATLLLLGTAGAGEARSGSAAAGGEKSDTPEGKGGNGGRGNYILQQQDLLRVQVYPEDDLKLEVRVSQELTVTLPLIGTVELKGRTVRQAEELIRQRYAKDFLVDPQVSVLVIEYWKRFVKVLGAVNTQGVVAFPPEEGLTLLDAISRAGGFSRLANQQKVTLTRVNADGSPDSRVINAAELLKGGTSDDIPLQPDDVISVPEKIL
jgi:polysaccharide biosynthesis/export protein